MRDQGSEVNSPRQAFKAAFKLGWIKDELIWDQIIRERTNVPVNVSEDPLLSVVKGTGMVLENLKKYESVLL